MQQCRRRVASLMILSALMLGSWVPAQAQFPVPGGCQHKDVVSVLGLRIERCWRKTAQNPTWLVTALAFMGDGSYLCQRWYNYVGSPGDAKDRASVQFVFDSNGDNYPDCYQNVPPPDDGDGSCTLPREREPGQPPIGQ